MSHDIEAIRRRLGLSRAAIARQLGISRNTWGRYETGATPAPRHIWLACLALWHRLDDRGI